MSHYLHIPTSASQLEVMGNVATIKETDFKFPGQTGLYHGKVRDVYTINSDYLVMVATDRISAFDVVLPKAIPFKGQVLNQIAAAALEATKDIVPNWVELVPDPNVTLGIKCEPFMVEIIIRGYLVGSAWRAYADGARELCGVALAEELKENQKFDEPIITPTTKADQGHDENITPQQILDQKLMGADEWKTIEEYAFKLFIRGTELAAKRGLILVDTKYEFGKTKDGKILLIDEVHTPDSSRFFYTDQYEKQFKVGGPQKQLSKEFVREWLMEHGFQGQAGEKMPKLSDEFIEEVSNRYVELYEQVTGEKFKKAEDGDIASRIEKNVTGALEELNG